MTEYEVFVPTYNRPRPAILQMLDKDENLRLTFCVRSDVDLSIYAGIPHQDRIDWMFLGSNIEDIGETRHRILQYSAKRTKRCIMLDDGLTNIYDKTDSNKSISDCILDAIKLMDKYDAFCYTFYRDGNHFLGVSEDDEVFVGPPLQAFMIDTKKAIDLGIYFWTMKICGLEDIAFFTDAVKKGQLFVSNQSICIDGKLPNVLIEGGNHSDIDKLKFEIERDKSHKILSNYIGKMYGVMFTKKYRQSLGQLLTYCRIDYSYFRDCLYTYKEENKQIVENHFMMED